MDYLVYSEVPEKAQLLSYLTQVLDKRESFCTLASSCAKKILAHLRLLKKVNDES